MSNLNLLQLLTINANILGKPRGIPECFSKVLFERLCVRSFLLIGLVSLMANQVIGQEYGLEFENGSLLNGASVQQCSSCSNEGQVGNIGGTDNGTVVNTVEVDKAADYELTLYYSSGDPRSVFLTVNDQNPIQVNCAASGGWSTPGSTTVLIRLEAGSNTLKFDNPSSWGPNLDRVEILLGKTYSISGKVTGQEGGIAGLEVQLNGYLSSNVYTDEDGNYSFADLPANRNFTISPSSEDNQFVPVYLSYPKLENDQVDQDFQAVEHCTDCHWDFGFGDNGRIIYDSEIGTFDIQLGDDKILENVLAEVINNDIRIGSQNFSTRTVKEEEWSDDLGSGHKWIVSHIDEHLPTMNQIFYCYENKDFILLEVELEGENLSSNYMAPIVTNTGEVPGVGSMRALSIPFDNDGFVRYQSERLLPQSRTVSSEVTAVYDNVTRRGLVIGSVNQEKWKSGVIVNGHDNHITELMVHGGFSDPNITRDHKEHGKFEGNQIRSPKVMVGLFDDWRDGMEEFGKAIVTEQPKYVFDWVEPTPFGWNSWGAIQTDLSLDKAKKVVDFFNEQVPGFRSGGTAYIDLDSYWDNMVSGGLEGDFSKLIEFVRYCKDRNLKAGIYWAPFVDWGKSNRKVEGSSYEYNEVWTKVNGGYHDFDDARAMDPTHPATKQRIDLVIDKFIKCGFEMVKIDFIGHAAVEADSFYDPEVKTGMQAFHQGMQHLIDAIDDKMLVYVAISPNLATGRYAHSRRIACDAYADINATDYTLNSTTYGWWQSEIYDFIDADHMVFGQASFGENKARFNSGIINGTLITGDDYSKSGPWTTTAVNLLQNQEVLDIAKDGRPFRPLEGDSHLGASEVFVKDMDGLNYVAIINYGGTSKNYNISLERLGIPNGEYAVKDLYSGKYNLVTKGQLEIQVGAKNATLLRFDEGLINATPIERKDSNALIFPNPVSDLLNIRSDFDINKIKLLGLNGEIVLEVENVDEKKCEVNIEHVGKGIYIVYLEGFNGLAEIHKLIKK
ncbi:T9SS type A sorting domain-containing protein [Echinicola shivajiensis]|uniref:T9SS type A sorting domain-containing protein n=1 Tax=Echinicola shivajiensis TaxID=1035916 RepID=UPI001BFC0317|nr:T9SS type A sorting domain-containing protein [Echinicola shivajiensis]